MSWLIHGLTGVVAAGWCLIAAPARAHCGDDCYAPLPYSVEHASAVVAADGVLGFHFDFGRGATALEFLTVTVRDAEGTEVAGTLTANEAFSLLIWRPDAPWVAGATYTVGTSLDTAGWSVALYGGSVKACVTEEITREITIEAAPLPAPEAAPLTVTTTYERRRGNDVDSVVCCDGAMPSMQPVSFGSCPEDQLAYSRGSCLARLDRGRLQVVHDVDRATLPPAVAGNLVVRVLDAEGKVLLDPRPWLHAAQCLQFESLDLARGEVFVEERCLGGDDELGDIEIDPSDQLGEVCEGQAYVCESDHRRWDKEACKTWPDGEDYEYVEPAQEPAPGGEVRNAVGYGCSTQSGPHAGSLVVLALALLGRRRRVGAGRRGAGTSGRAGCRAADARPDRA